MIVRVAGPSTRVLLSDITAATEWQLAQSALDDLGLPALDDLDDDHVAPAGDLDLLADLGMHAMDMGVLIDDDDLYPDEMLSEVARALGFGEHFDDAVGLDLCMSSPDRAASSRCGSRWPKPESRSPPTTCRSAPSSSPLPAGDRGSATTSARSTTTRPVTPRWSRCGPRRTRSGSWRLTGCTLVVTLEPCTMCAGALVLARVERIVFGAFDDKAGAVGSLWDVVRDRRLNHRPEVVAGVLAAESSALLDGFFASHR